MLPVRSHDHHAAVWAHHAEYERRLHSLLDALPHAFPKDCAGAFGLILFFLLHRFRTRKHSLVTLARPWSISPEPSTSATAPSAALRRRRHVLAISRSRFPSFGRRPRGSFLIGSAAVRAIAASICLRISAFEGPGRDCGAVFCFMGSLSF